MTASLELSHCAGKTSDLGRQGALGESRGVFGRQRRFEHGSVDSIDRFMIDTSVDEPVSASGLMDGSNKFIRGFRQDQMEQGVITGRDRTPEVYLTRWPM